MLLPPLTKEDARQILDVRIALEPLAFALAAQRATENEISQLWDLLSQTSERVEAADMDGFFEKHLEYRRRVWTLSGNRYIEQTLERFVVPLYALYLIRGAFNREGPHQTAI